MPSLEERFLRRLGRLGIGDRPAHLLVAVSGGCDSVVLLHLLRFAARSLPLSLTVAHLDHAMRPGSDADARWLAGVCAAWGLPLVRERLRRPPAGEDAARRARYAFLRRAAREAGAEFVVTAHHADDQAETVLFRVLRGTGLRGLGGIRGRTRSGLLRPLLPFWRRDLERYARSRRLRWRTDPTNLLPGPARNRIRLRLLPEAEREIAPAARRNLVALARLAREAEAGWERVVAPLERAAARAENGGIVLARAAVRDYDSAVALHLLRKLLRRFGVVPGRTGTRTALQFITDAPSGRELQLPGGVRIRTEFGEARIERAGEPPAEDEPLRLSLDALPASGPPLDGTLRVGGRGYRVHGTVEPWRAGGESLPTAAWSTALRRDALRFPLCLRGWRAGDRMRTRGGTKTLKKLFLEHRVPRSRRALLPVLVDADGSVLWVGEIGGALDLAPREGEPTLFLTLVASD